MVVCTVPCMLQIGDAMQRMHDRKNIGKIILDPSLEPKPAADVRKCRRCLEIG